MNLREAPEKGSKLQAKFWSTKTIVKSHPIQFIYFLKNKLLFCVKETTNIGQSSPKFWENYVKTNTHTIS